MNSIKIKNYTSYIFSLLRVRNSKKWVFCCDALWLFLWFWFLFGPTFIIFYLLRLRLIYAPLPWPALELLLNYFLQCYFVFSMFFPLFSCILLDWALFVNLLYFPLFVGNLIICFLLFCGVCVCVTALNYFIFKLKKYKFNQYIFAFCLSQGSKEKQ